MKAACEPVKILRMALVFGLICLIAYGSRAQTVEPQHDQLLNGLRVLLWTRPGDQTVLLKLRIHSGAIFDTAGKAGTMALLGDILFPDPATREYFTAEMGGRLEVDTDYDSINVTLQGRASEYDRIVDILRSALVTTPLTAENVARAREARMKKLSQNKPVAGEIADLAIANRLLGPFPYTQPIGGAVESLRNVEWADARRGMFMSPITPPWRSSAVPTSVGRCEACASCWVVGGRADRAVLATFRKPDAPISERHCKLAGFVAAEVRAHPGPGPRRQGFLCSQSIGASYP